MNERKRLALDEEKSLSAKDFAGSGIQFAAALVLAILLGNWLDKKFATSPLFLLLGLVIGGGGGFYSLYRKISAAQRTDDERRKRRTTGEA